MLDMHLLFCNCRREAFVLPFIPGTVPAWSDACFNAVDWVGRGSPPRAEGDDGWVIARSPATDAEGWVYGTAFEHLREERPGGRASKRANDRVRCRLWRRPAAAEAPALQPQQQQPQLQQKSSVEQPSQVRVSWKVCQGLHGLIALRTGTQQRFEG